MAGGKKTSHGGQILEQVIGALKLRRFAIRSHDPTEDEEARLNFQADNRRWLIKNYPYTTIFGTPGRREWFLDAPEWTGQLECKFQNSGGSVDEKMVYLVETLCRSQIASLALVHGGRYWTEENRGRAIVAWLKKEAESVKHHYGKSLIVLDLDGFFTWVGKTFP
jgi:hypothetical protein